MLRESNSEKRAFQSSGKGFAIRFDNGITVSVQWGPGNYADNRHQPYTATDQQWASNAAEVAACTDDNWWRDFGSDQARGYVTAEEMLEFMNEMSHPDAKSHFKWKDYNR